MNKKKILYVEDDETLGFLTADSLENRYEVMHYTNGKEAFDSFCSQSYDLCVLDVMLPDMDGFEIATEIRKRNKEIPILFLSAKTMKEDRIKGLKLGADDYLVKPYSMEELILKLKFFLTEAKKILRLFLLSMILEISNLTPRIIVLPKMEKLLILPNEKPLC